MSHCCQLLQQQQQQQSTLTAGIPSGLVLQTYPRSSLGQVRSILANGTATGCVSVAEWYHSCLDLPRPSPSEASAPLASGGFAPTLETS